MNLSEHCQQILNIKTSQDALDAFAEEWCKGHPEAKPYRMKDEGKYFEKCEPISETVVKITMIYWDYRKTDTGHFEWMYNYKVDVNTGLLIED